MQISGLGCTDPPKRQRMRRSTEARTSARAIPDCMLYKGFPRNNLHFVEEATGEPQVNH